MKRYFLVGSDGKPHEVSYYQYLKYSAEPYFTTYVVGDNNEKTITSVTKETENEPFPNCS